MSDGFPAIMSDTTAAKAVVPCEALTDSTSYPGPTGACEFRTKIENTGRWRGPIPRVRCCADKLRPAVRSSFSKDRFESRGTQVARPGHWRHSREQCGRFPPQRRTRTRAIFREQ